MTIVDNLVYNLVNEHKVFADALFVEDAAVVAENLHHTVYDVQNGRWGHVSLACCHKVDSKLLSEEVVDSINMESGGRVTWPKLDLAEEHFARLLAKVKAEVAFDDSIASC